MHCEAREEALNARVARASAAMRDQDNPEPLEHGPRFDCV